MTIRDTGMLTPPTPERLKKAEVKLRNGKTCVVAVDSDNKQLVEPTAERLLKGDVDVAYGDRGGKEARSFADPMDFYLRKGLVTEEQHMAGTDFAETWFRAFYRSHYAQWGYRPHVGSTYRVPGLLTDEMIRYYHLLGQIRGVKEIEMTIGVCCMKRKAGKRGGMAYLISGLDDLVKYHRKKR